VDAGEATPHAFLVVAIQLACISVDTLTFRIVVIDIHKVTC